MDTPPTDKRATKSSLYDEYAASIKHVLLDDPGINVAELETRISWSRSPSTLAKYVARARLELAQGSAVSPSVEPTLSTPTLPTFATNFVGRRTELARLRTLLGEHRLVTITGPGGIGKTRLAVHAADQMRRAFADGVRFVELASLRSPQLLAQTVLDGLGLAGRDQPGATAEAALIDYLRDRRMLVILDNCEHLIAACAELVHTVLQHSSAPSMIITSREVLALPEEFAFPLDPLPISGPANDSVDTAMALFESRADAVLGGFTIDNGNRDAVRRVCEGLDGIPLAIELACARLPVLSVTELADRLDHRLDLLTTGNRGAPRRHQSLISTLDWSHDHCTAEQQLLWTRASVFAGGFDLAMAERVCADERLPATRLLDAISALVSKSILLREEIAGSLRFRMLETVREYGQSRLDDAEDQILHQRLLEWSHHMSELAVRDWHGPGQEAINARIRANRANLRQALQWSLESSRENAHHIAAQITADPWFLWASGFSVREHRLWLARVAELLPAESTAQGRVLATLGLVQTLQGDRATAAGVLRTAVAISERLGDEATHDFAVHTTGLMEYFAGVFERSEELLLQTLDHYRRRRPRAGLLSALEIHLGMHFAFTGQLDLSSHHFTEVYQRSEEAGERWFRAYAAFGRGLVSLFRDAPQPAREFAREGLILIRDFDDVVGATLITDLLGWSEAVLGSAERAAVLLGSASTLWGSFGQQLYGSSHWVDIRQRYADLARAQLGPEDFDRFGRQGAAMSVPALMSFALGETPASAAESDRPADVGLTMLTRREREVAALVARGLSNKEIAAKLVLSPRTIEGHVEHVLQKLCLTKRTQVAAVVGDLADAES